MKSTGIVRRVDELGRIVLPIELRRTLDITERDSLEIYVDGSSIILKFCSISLALSTSSYILFVINLSNFYSIFPMTSHTVLAFSVRTPPQPARPHP